MLVCLSCPKHSNLSSPGSPLHHEHGTASPRPLSRRSSAHIKNFTAQLKDIVMKFSSGAYRHCKVCSSTHHDDHDQQDMSRSSVDASEAAATSSRLSPTNVHQFGEFSPTPYDHLLPTAPRRHSSQRRTKNSVFPATPKRSISLDSKYSYDKEIECPHKEEWVAQVEPGVMITFVALPDGSNDLKRIRFSRELFSKWQAQLWWTENCDMVHELYTVSRSCTETCDSSPVSSCSSHQEEEEALRNTPETLSTIDSTHNSPSRMEDYLFLNVSSNSCSRDSPSSQYPSATVLIPHAVNANISTDQLHEQIRESGYEGSFSCSSSTDQNPQSSLVWDGCFWSPHSARHSLLD